MKDKGDMRPRTLGVDLAGTYLETAPPILASRSENTYRHHRPVGLSR